MYLLMILSYVAQVLCLLLFFFASEIRPTIFVLFVYLFFWLQWEIFLLFDTRVRIFCLFSFEEKFSTQGWSKIVKIAVFLI